MKGGGLRGQYRKTSCRNNMKFIETAMSCLPFYLSFMIANRNDLVCQSEPEMEKEK